MTPMTGYIYDADGERVAKGTIAAWSCDPSTNGFQLTQSYVRSAGGESLTVMGPNGTPLYQNVSGAGRLLVAYDSQGTHYQVTDPLGTRRMQTDAQGVPEMDFEELPYGDGLTAIPDPNDMDEADDATPFHFTGKERDLETGFANGNDYFDARYYASSMGRFLSPDWAAKIEPVPYGKMDDPQTLNLYHYMRNNPLGGVDRDGHCGGVDCFISLVTAATQWVAAHPKISDAIGNLIGSTSMTVKAGPGFGAKVGSVDASLSLTSAVKVPIQNTPPTTSLQLRGSVDTPLGGLSSTTALERTGNAQARLTESIDAGKNPVASTVVNSDGDEGETSFGLEFYAGGGGGIDFSWPNEAIGALTGAISDAVQDFAGQVSTTIKTAISTAGCNNPSTCSNAAQNAANSSVPAANQN